MELNNAVLCPENANWYAVFLTMVCWSTEQTDGLHHLHVQEAGELVQVLQADEDVANCVKPHPSLPLLATSGIESVIRCVTQATRCGCKPGAWPHEGAWHRVVDHVTMVCLCGMLTCTALLIVAVVSLQHWCQELLLCRLWSPGDVLVEQDMDQLVHDNQDRMQEGPQLLRGINPRIMQVHLLGSAVLSCSSLLIFPWPGSNQPTGLRQLSSVWVQLINVFALAGAWGQPGAPANAGAAHRRCPSRWC
jgi:hypothetical protein